MTEPRSIQDVYAEPPIAEDTLAALLSESLAPRRPDMLFDIVAVLGLQPGARVLDVGCRDARHACELARRFDSTVVALDPLPEHIAAARRRIATEGLGERVTADQGAIEALPIGDASIDLIWCRDVLNHVALHAGLAECARVLRKGGAMVVFQTFATDLLEPREAASLFAALATVPENMAPAFFEATAAAAGLSIERCDIVASEWREAGEEDGTRRTSEQLLRIARLRRARERFVAAMGAKAYEAELADCIWGVYQMLGKLCPRVYVLRRF
jgi:SAM-dependent methyltransferase